jgi:uncharacterized protein (TIGR02145 family)
MRSCPAVFLLLITLSSSGLAQDTVQVQAGWNIIGSVKAGAIPDIITTDPPGIITTSFFGYAPGTGYRAADTLGKGLGYWVKVSADGIIIFGGGISSDTCGIKQVPYNGVTYHTVLIGDQCWLKENMNVGTMIDNSVDQIDNDVYEKYCYNDDSLNCTIYGGLYQWNEAMNYSAYPGVQGICPPGWHLPTTAELQTLSSAVAGDGNALKEVGQGTGAGAGTNTSGFSALLAGYMQSNETFNDLGAFTGLWSSTSYNSTEAKYLYLYSNVGSLYVSLYGYSELGGLSVRCIQD